ncbi:1096_t:CDS:2, partial [Gigaspora margarita]
TAIGTFQLTLSDYIKEDSISNFLIKELAESIPINPERLQFTDRLQRANVALLEFLTSNFAGFPTFNSPFSNSVKCWIYWMTIINTFINSIPQLVMQ